MFELFFDGLASDLGVPSDQLRYVACILLTYPISFAYLRLLPHDNYTLKHLFSIVTTLLLFIFVHDQWIGLVHLAVTSLVTYGILLSTKSSLGPKLVFVWAMTHMAYTHLNRQLYQYGQTKMDFSGPQMVWTIKLTMFACNVYDGQRSEEKLSAYQISRRITTLPSFTEFLGYILYSGGFFVGPAFEYSDYISFVKSDKFRNSKTGEISIPSTILPALSRFFTGLACALVPVFVYPRINMFRLLGSDFVQYPLIGRLFLIYLAGTAERFKYYFAWLLAEGSCVLSGLGYIGQDDQGKHQWGGITNVRIAKVELAENFRMVMENWNIGTNIWLRNYIYLRLAPAGSKNTFFAQVATFASSAFWHGFYPGYYLTFLFGSIINEQARFLRRRLRPLIMASGSPFVKRAYDVLGWVSTAMALNYVVVPFVVLTAKKSLYIYRNVYFLVHIATLVIMVTSRLQLIPKQKEDKSSTPTISLPQKKIS